MGMPIRLLVQADGVQLELVCLCPQRSPPVLTRAWSCLRFVDEQGGTTGLSNQIMGTGTNGGASP